MAKESEKEYQKTVREHYKLQSQQTKLSMKELKREQNSYNKSKEHSFFERLFNKDCR